MLGIKKSKPTFNSKYDKGIYEYPLQGGKQRFHPTQKSLPLFEDLIKKHSNEGDLVLDCFAGSATTAIAAMNTDRRFIGCEMEEEYYNKSLERINEQNNTNINMKRVIFHSSMCPLCRCCSFQTICRTDPNINSIFRFLICVGQISDQLSTFAFSKVSTFCTTCYRFLERSTNDICMA